MNSCEDQTEPMGEAPEVGVPIMKFGPAQQVTRYRSRCTNCGFTLALFEYDSADEAIEDAVKSAGWSKRTGGPEDCRIELLCAECQGGRA